MSGSRRLAGRAVLVWAAIWLLCLAAFVALGIRASTGTVLAADLRIARWVQSGPHFFAWLTEVANDVNLAPVLAIVVVVPAAWLARRGFVFESVVLAGTLAVRVLQDAAKYIFDEPRPAATLIRVTEFPSNPGFPSGHVTGTTALFVLVFVFAPLLLRPRLTFAARAFSIFMVAWIPFARIWVGAHWPTDCLGGYLFALLYLIPVLAAAKTHPATGCATLGLPWRGGRSRPAADSAGRDR
jgi:membrane-associated phospholipid phosphatase